jgi:hypothetical protein
MWMVKIKREKLRELSQWLADQTLQWWASSNLAVLVVHYAVFRSCSFPRSALAGFRCPASWKHRQDEQKIERHASRGRDVRRMILRSTKVYGLRQGNPWGLVAIVLSESVPGPWSAFRGMGQDKATGLAAVAGGLAESVFSPRSWILAVVFFALFFVAGRLRNKLLRVFLFWTPTLTVSVL